MFKRTTITDVVQGIIVGAVLAFITANLLINAGVNVMQTTVSGWSITLKCGEFGNDILLRAACAKDIPAANLAAEAVYWMATVDDAGNTLNGQHDYILHFPHGSIYVYIQQTAPTGHESNWLPAPTGDFMLWLRAYQPGAAVLSGEYHVPPVVVMK